MSRILVVGEIRFSTATVNPWLSNSWVRKTRNHVSAATLGSVMAGDLLYTAHALSAAGFNVVSLANPELSAQGDTNLRSTAKALARRRVACVGLGEGDEAYAPALVDNGGEKVAFFGAAAGPSRHTGGLHIARASDSRLHEAVNIAVLEGARKTYLLLHAGPEEVDYGRLLLDFDGIIVSGREMAELEEQLSSFVAISGVFHNADAGSDRVANAIWIHGLQASQEMVRQEVNPPFTRSTSIESLPKLLQKIAISTLR